MKISISLPDRMLKEADVAARKLRISRSKLIQTALLEFLNNRKAEDVTRRLNESLRSAPSRGSIRFCSSLPLRR